MRKVLVIQRGLPHYRIRFFEELYAQGQSHDLDIYVCSAAPPSPTPLPVRFPFQVLPAFYFGKGRQCSYWLRGLENLTAGSDIVVAPQELQCLTVPYLWVRRKHICKTWIWWGHGYNFQASAQPSVVTDVKERLKEFMTKRADGLITYTERGADYWRRQGLSNDRVFPYFNTIDVEELRRTAAEISEVQRAELRRKLKLEGKYVLMFSGRLYAEKMVDFLLRAFLLLKESCPDVALLIIGDGEERDRLEQMTENLKLQDIHFLGEIVKPNETAVYFLLADVMVLPSLIGLAIVHGFAFGLPMITTSAAGHGPEIEYLSESNGIMTKLDISEYAAALQTLISSPEKLYLMSQAALSKGDKLSLQYSVQRFIDGIILLNRRKGM